MNLKYTMKGNDLAWDSWNQPSIRHIDRHPGKLSLDAVFLRLLYIIIVRLSTGRQRRYAENMDMRGQRAGGQKDDEDLKVPAGGTAFNRYG